MNLEKTLCMNCHEPLERMLIFALLSDLGCKGSCERVHICSATGKEHNLRKRKELDRWIVKLNGGQHDFSVFVPKGTKLTDVWSYAKTQHGGFTPSHLRKIVVGGKE